MNLTVRHVDPNYIQQFWPLVEGYIDEALQKGDDFGPEAKNYTTEHVRVFLTSSQWTLLVALDDEQRVHGAATVTMINYPLHRVAFVTTIGGKLISNEDTFNQLKTILKSFGATKIQGLGRPAIVRLWAKYNFEPRNTVVEVLI